MVTFKDRFASSQDMWLVFSVCAFCIFVWSIINVLQEVPAWILRLSMWDLIGIIAYTQSLALIETIVVFLILIVVGAILPAKLFREKFVAQAILVVLLTSIWFIIAHYYDIIGSNKSSQMALWGASYLIAIGASYFIVQRFKKVEKSFRFIGERLTPLSSVYLFVGFISLIIVMLRNL